MAKETKTSGMAIASFVLGLLGISILAIVFGFVALNQIKKSKNLAGKGLAKWGIGLGIFEIAILIMVGIVWAVVHNIMGIGIGNIGG